ncbi:MAG: glucose-1-phosphate cytidylyltransferase [Bacteroidales bacterium]|nr:glucose-1-phosphate cytidylyltransferase [Bacteroidales bacterium]
MKVVILAGGFGTRLSEETETIPKPMVKIGGKPIIWHIMKLYSHYGYNEFIILLGYKGYVIKEYFANYFLHQSDVTIDLVTNEVNIHANKSEPWKVSLIDTGLNTMTGGRIKRIEKFIGNERFMLTYGDGVANIDLNKLKEFHLKHNKTITLTSVLPEGRYGSLDITAGNKIERFFEKPKGDNVWINGGFFICEPEIFKYLENDNTIFEREPLEKLAKNGEVYGYKHDDFWKCMDTLRDKIQLNELWENNKAPWVVW